MISKDFDEFELARWTSPKFRIYTTNCLNAKESDKIGNCSLHDYDFGEDLKKKYNIESDVATSSKSECSKKCDQDEICTFSSWNANERKCLTLNQIIIR